MVAVTVLDVLVLVVLMVEVTVLVFWSAVVLTVEDTEDESTEAVPEVVEVTVLVLVTADNVLVTVLELVVKPEPFRVLVTAQ